MLKSTLKTTAILGCILFAIWHWIPGAFPFAVAFLFANLAGGMRRLFNGERRL